MEALRKPLVQVLLLLAAGLVVYSNGFQAPFFIDANFITENPLVRDITLPVENLRTLNLDIYSHARHRFVAFLTFALNYQLHGFSVFGYHALNICLHLLSALLVYGFTATLLATPFLEKSVLAPRRLAIAFFTALVFTVHPLMTEPVNWIWQRVALLAAFFYLAACTAYLRARLAASRGKRAGWYLLALAATLLAMKSKQNSFTIPVMIGLLEWIFFQGSWKKRLWRLAPFAATLVVIPATYLAMGFSPAESTAGVLDPTGAAMPRWSYLLTQFTVLLSYLRRVFWPYPLPFYESYPVYHTLLSAPVFFSFLGVMALFTGGILLVTRAKGARPEWLPAGFGLLWFFVANAVESSLVPFSVVIANYRAYLPAVGIFLALASACGLLVANWNESKQRLGVAGAFLLLLLLALLSHNRNAIWQTEIGLAMDAVRHSPGSPQAHLTLGLAYTKAGMTDEAGKAYDTAFQLDRETSSSQNPVAAPQPVKSAIPLLLRALSDDDAESFYNLAVAYYQSGETGRSLNMLGKALAIDAAHPSAHYYAGLIHHEQGRYDLAIREYAAAVKNDPTLFAARTNLGAVYAQLGRYDEAVEELGLALAIAPSHAEAHRFLGLIYQDTGRLDEAEVHLQEATRLQPDSAMARNNLGEIRAQRGMLKEAALDFMAALRLDPNFTAAKLNLERVSGSAGGRQPGGMNP